MAGGANSNFGHAMLQQSGMLGQMGGRAGGGQESAQGPVGYTPVTPNVYRPSFTPMQQAPMNPAQQVQQAGLQALMANMMAQYQNVPGALAMTQQRPQMPAPRFSAPALSYRPDIQSVQQNLSRVKPSVYKTDLDNARARIAELEAAEQARNAASDTGYYSGG